MTANKISPKAVLLKVEQFNSLVEQGRKAGQVTVNGVVDDLPIEALRRLQGKGGAFEYLNDSGKDIHSVHDLKAKYNARTRIKLNQ